MREFEYKKRDRKFYPSRAIYAEVAGHAATATWLLKAGEWKCHSASRWLKWMRGMTDFKKVKELLSKHDYRWHWIPSPMVSGPKAPF